MCWIEYDDAALAKIYSVFNLFAELQGISGDDIFLERSRPECSVSGCCRDAVFAVPNQTMKKTTGYQNPFGRKYEKKNKSEKQERTRQKSREEIVEENKKYLEKLNESRTSSVKRGQNKGNQQPKDETEKCKSLKSNKFNRRFKKTKKSGRI